MYTVVCRPAFYAFIDQTETLIALYRYLQTTQKFKLVKEQVLIAVNIIDLRAITRCKQPLYSYCTFEKKEKLNRPADRIIASYQTF